MNNYVNTEKSLKRWLKSKVKITMATIVGFLITGTVTFSADITETINVTNNTATKITKTDNINMNLNTAEAKPLNGIFLNSNNLTDKSTFNELDVQSGKVNMNITTTSGDATGVYIAKGGKVNLGTKNTENIIINTKTQSGYATGLQSIGNTLGATGNPSDKKIIGGPITVNGKSLDIISNSESGIAAGIWVQTNTIYEPQELENKIADGTMVQSGVILNTEKTSITVNSNESERGLGIVAYSNSFVEVNGDLEIKQANDKTTQEKGISAISTRGHSTVKINESGKNTVKIDGDIEFSFHAPTSGTTVDANVILNLSNANSYFNGKIFVEGNPTIGKDKVNSMNLGLSNGGTWTNTGDSFVNNLTMNGGVINNSDVNSDIKVDNLAGTGGTLNIAVEIGNDGKATSGALNINTINDNTKLNINYSGTDNLEVNKEKAEEVFGQLAEKITVENGNLNATAKLEEGFVSSEYVSELTKNENGNVAVKEDSVKVGNLNSMVEGMRDLATINLLTWRQEMNSLNKRMGELRNSTGEHGVWSRVYTGKIENGSKYDNDYQTYQVGYDKKYTVDNGVMFVGGLVSYTDGETDYALGHGENYSVGAGIYATWLNNDGQFADVVLKQSRLHNKFDVTSKNGKLSQSGDYNNWGTSLSGQYGRRFDLNEKFFVEPSVELTLGRVDDTTYTTSAGVGVHQDTMYSLVGNVGTAVGYKFSDKGNVYARASLVKEFQGDIDTEYKKDGAVERTSEDLGDTWAEFGAGVNYRFIENMNVYVDVQKTGEAQVDNKWQANLGFRYEF